MDSLDNKSSVEVIGKSDSSEDADANPEETLTMAHDRAIAHKASGHDTNAVLKDTVKWYMDVLGFQESTAKALYTNQMLTEENVLIDLSDKSVDDVCAAICKPGGR